MNAKLTIDIHGLTSVQLIPETEAERLILERMAECKQAEIYKNEKGGQYNSYEESNRLASLTITELRDTGKELIR